MKKVLLNIIISFFVVLLSSTSLSTKLSAQDDVSGETVDTEAIVGDSTNLTDPVPYDSSEVSSASDTLIGKKDSKVLTKFNKYEMELEQGDVISNVLTLYNKTDDPIKFTLDVLHPGTWKQIANSDKPYEIAPKDTIFIPIVLIPSKLIDGNTEVIINAFIIDMDGYQIGDNHFSLKTKKKTSWDVRVLPSNKFYFKNDEKHKEFSYTITNTGNFKQDIFVHHRSLKGKVILSDTNHIIAKNTTHTITLKPLYDTTFTYNVSLEDGVKRNFRNVSLFGYTPLTNHEYQKSTLFLKTSEAKGIGNNVYTRGNKIDFIRLPNETKMLDYGYPSFPLTMELNVQNILDLNSFMSINFRGFKQLSQKASLSYFTQLNYNRAIFTTDPFRNLPWYIGYFDDKKSIEVGQVNSNIIGAASTGKGIRASYSYLSKHRTTGFYVRSLGFFGTLQQQSFGAMHEYKASNVFNLTASAGRTISNLRNNTVDAFSLQPRFKIAQKHVLSLIGALSNRTENNVTPSVTKQGYLYGANYSSHFLQKRLRTFLGARYSDRNFSYGTFEKINTTNRTNYTISDKWDVNLTNNYQNITFYNTITDTISNRQEIFNNNLVFNTKNVWGNIQPGLFFDYSKFNFNRVHMRGVSLRFAKSNFLQNFLTSTFLRAGYSMPLDIAPVENYFLFQINSLLRYRVWNFNAFYNYGFTSIVSFQNPDFITGSTPQTLRLSLQKQHQFKNKHFVLQTNLVYNYFNVFDSHSIGIFPELFYFTNSGWRFSLRANYSWSSNSFRNINTARQSVLENPNEDIAPTTNQNFNLSANVVKNFGIPIPFVKNTTASLDFVAFYDINGNGKKEKSEPGIENVVVRLGAKEVLTTEDGKAWIQNIPLETYKFNVLSLDLIDGWFPNIPDTLEVVASNTQYIPYVRGVKIYGDVVLDRQKIAIVDDKPFDLSRIKISAVNGLAFHTLTDMNGRFEFYVPNGEYTITMDETVLTSKYELTRNNIPLSIKNTQDGIYLSFYIIEKRRKVKFKDFSNGKKNAVSSNNDGQQNLSDVYDNRIEAINRELDYLKEQLKTATGEERQKIQDRIDELNRELESLNEKKRNSGNVTVESNLSEEMQDVVRNDVRNSSDQGNGPTVSDVPYTEGLAYRIQVGFFKEKLPENHFGPIKPVIVSKPNLYYKYIVGDFKRYDDAVNTIKNLKKLGYTDTFVLSFFNGKKTAVSDARQYEELHKND